MSLGAALGVSGGRGLSGNMMVEPSLRVLALVTDAFGGHGGIAQYNRDLLSSLARCERIGEVLVLPRGAVTSPGMLPSGIRQLLSCCRSACLLADRNGGNTKMLAH